MERMDTNYRRCIPLSKRVAIGLYALGSSAEYRTIANMFGVGRTTVGAIVLEFCELVCEKLLGKYINAYPLTEETIEANIDGFEQMGFPQCIGAIGNCSCKDESALIHVLNFLFRWMPYRNFSL